MDEPPEHPTRPSRRPTLLLAVAMVVSMAFACWQMWVYVSSSSRTARVAPNSTVLVAPSKTDPRGAIYEAILPITDPPPLAIPAGAAPQGAWILNRVQNGRVDLQWTYDIMAKPDAIFSHFANLLTADGFRRLGKRGGRFIGPTEVWRKNENIISISLRMQGKNPKIRLILRQVREAIPSDFQRRFPRQ